MDFKDYKRTTFEDITTYCEEEHPDYLDTIEKSIDEGKSFLAIKRAFYEEYFEEYIPARKKSKTMKEWAKARKG